MLQRLKSWMLPIAMLTGAVGYPFFAKLSFLTPFLIFTMLLITYCKLTWKHLSVSRFHFWLLAIQIFGSIAVYGLLHFFDPLVAQGTFVCVLAPTATAAVVITGMLGGDIAVLATFSLLSNMSIALVAPFLFSVIGDKGNLPFLESFSTICAEVIPLLILPFILAIALHRFYPSLHRKIQNYQNLSFYIWAVSLTIVVGSTVSFVMAQDKSSYREELWIAFFSMLVCVLQFYVGRRIGKHYSNTVAGGQALGQKNTILAIWMALTYLNPLASIGPASYVLWQNIINSWQLWRKRKKQGGV